MLKAVLTGAPARYLLVGGSCAALNNLILIAGDAVGLHYAVCLLLTCLVVPIAYMAHASWSFAASPSWRGFVHYVAGSSSSLIIGSATVALFRGGLELPMAITAPLATLLLTLYNYWMTRWVVNRSKPCTRGLVINHSVTAPSPHTTSRIR